MLAVWPLLLALSLSAQGQVRLTLSDSEAKEYAPVESQADSQADSMHGETEGEEPAHYPNCVSHAPGWPRKPLWERPGDVNQSSSPAPRYCQDEGFRTGWPNTLRKFTGCSITPHYSAWYVGGGSALGLPHHRPRTTEEGTWGLDYSLFKKPNLIWMRWTCGRAQGGEGAYATDR